MLVVREASASSWSTEDEASCRCAIRVLDWASLLFWLISGSKNSAMWTARRPVIKHAADPLAWEGRLHLIWFCSLFLYTMCGLVFWQMTLTDCLKYQNGHSSTLGHTRLSSVLLSTQLALPCLASPRLASPNKQQLSAVGCHASPEDCS